MCLYIYYLCFSLCMHFCRCVSLSLHTSDSTGIETGLVCVPAPLTHYVPILCIYGPFQMFRRASVDEVCVCVYPRALLNTLGTQAPCFLLTGKTGWCCRPPSIQPLPSQMDPNPGEVMGRSEPDLKKKNPLTRPQAGGYLSELCPP